MVICCIDEQCKFANYNPHSFERMRFFSQCAELYDFMKFCLFTTIYNLLLHY